MTTVPSNTGTPTTAPPESTDLTVAVSVGQKMLAAFGDSSGFDTGAYAAAHGGLAEALRILLRALGAEPDADDDGMCPACDTTPIERCTACGSCRCDRHDTCVRPAVRCKAAHPEDPSPCGGPVVVTILDANNAGTEGCEHHAVRLLASLTRGRVYGLPDAPAGTAGRVLKAAYATRPFCWADGPRTRPEQLSRAENRQAGDDQ